MYQKLRKYNFLSISAPDNDWRWTSKGLLRQKGSDILHNEFFGAPITTSTTFGKVQVYGVSTAIIAKRVMISGSLVDVAQRYLKTGGSLVTIN